MKKTNNLFLRTLKLTYLKLFRINDTPQKIALGLGLGVFLGILPGTGPIAAFTLALFFRINRAAALLGSLLTNTWLSVVIFLLSIKVGAIIMKLDWHQVYNNWVYFLSNFHWQDLFKSSVLNIILPAITGYVVVGLTLGVIVYLVCLITLVALKYEDKNRGNISRGTEG